MDGIYLRQNGKQEMVITKETFEILKKDRKFVSVITLGRVFNPLMASLDDYIEYKDDKTPRETRQKNAAFVAALGYLHEGINLCYRMNKDFETDRAFKLTIGKLLKTKKLEEFNDKLARIRNSAAFHFFDNVTQKTLNKFDFDEYVFLSANGNQVGDMHFELSENVSNNSWLSALKPEEEKQELEQMLTKSLSLFHKTVIAIQDFIWRYMNSLTSPRKRIKKPRTSQRIRRK